MKYNNALFIGILGTACSLSLGDVVGAEGLGSSDIAIGNTGAYPMMVIDVSGFGFYGEQGNVLNDVIRSRIFGVKAGSVTIMGLGWDLNMETVGASWLSEATLGLGGTNLQAMDLTPFLGEDFPGSGHASSNGIFDLQGKGMQFQLGDDNTFQIELFESFVDDPGGLDAFFLEGSTITIEFQATLPSPGGVGVMVVCGIGLTRRRR